MDSIHAILILGKCSSFSILIPLLLSLNYIRTFNLSLKVLFIYILLSILVEILTGYLSINNINNLFIYYYFSFLEFVLFVIIYFHILNIYRKKMLMWCIISIFGLICLIDFLLLGGDNKMNELSRNVESVSLITLSIFYFNSLIKNSDGQNLLQQFSFWFNSSIIIYFSGSFFIFLFSNYMLDESPDTFFAIYAIHSIFNIIFNILLAISLTKKTDVA